MARYSIKDVALAQRVQSLFDENQRLATFPIKVTATNGTVYLSGRVGNPRIRMEAEMLASGTTGVKRVINQLTPESQ